jgi:hypothetical protein
MVSIRVVVIFVARFKFSQLEVFLHYSLLLKRTWRSWKNKEIFGNITIAIFCWQELAKNFTHWLREACGFGKCMWTNEQLKAKFVDGVEFHEFIEVSDINYLSLYEINGKTCWCVFIKSLLNCFIIIDDSTIVKTWWWFKIVHKYICFWKLTTY